MPHFLKNSAPTEAHQWRGTRDSYDAIASFVAPAKPVWRARDSVLLLPTGFGLQAAHISDWIIPCSKSGGFRPMRACIFDDEYSPLPEDPAND